MTTDAKYFWYNYQTRKYEERSTPETDEDAEQLIPQLAINLYRLRRVMGDDILEAMDKTLRACVGEPTD